MHARKSSVLVCLAVCLLFIATHLHAAQVQLSWNAPTTNADGTTLRDLAGYRLHYGLSSRNYTSSVNVGNTTSYTLSGLTSGQRYYVAVTAYDTSGNQSSYSNEVNFVAPSDSTTAPVANFTAAPTSGTVPLTVAFTSTSTGNITSYAWTFGDGGTSTAQNPTYTYQNAGSYTVSLKVTGPAGTHTATKTNYITANPATSTPSGLVAAYNFDQGSGSTLTDVSGRNHHGRIYGAAWTNSGKYGKALAFDGVNDFVKVSDSTALDLTTGMTLEAWVYPTASQSGQRPVIKKEAEVYFLHAGSTTGTLRPSGGVTIGSTIKSVTAPNAIPVNAWSHLALTYNGSTLRLYVNGAQVASASVSGTIKNGGALRIGGDSVYKQYFQGRVDDIRIYNRALTATQVQADMNTPVKPVSSSAVVAGGASGAPIGKIFQNVFARAPVRHERDGTTSALDSPARRASEARSVVAGPLRSSYLETAEVAIDHQWKRVEFKRPFTDPIVIAKALSYQEASPAVVQIRGVDATGFEVRLQSWQDTKGTHQPETAGYLVFERGRYSLPDGAIIEAGSAEVDRRHDTLSLAFMQPFQVTPVVMTAVSSATGGETLTGRPSRINKQGFQFRLQPRGSDAPAEATETLSYVAWEPSMGTIDGLTFEVGRSLDVRRDRFHTLAFSEAFTEPPVFLADIQAAGGGYPVNVRWHYKDRDGIAVKLDEVPSNDGAISIALDMVGYIMIQ
jgi:PKD repeat protein